MYLIGKDLFSVFRQKNGEIFVNLLTTHLEDPVGKIEEDWKRKKIKDQKINELLLLYL